MKKLLTIAGVFLLLTTFNLTAKCQQFYGENFTNVPEVLNAELRGYVNDKVPVGDTYVACFRNDKYEGKCPDAEINNVIALRDELEAAGKHFVMIYTFQTRGQSLANNFYAFDQFRNAGINIIAARMGNEEWFKNAGHNSVFSHYKGLYDPIVNELTARSYAGDILLTFAKNENTWLNWNNACEAEIDLHDNFTADLHLYWNEKEVPAMVTYLVNDAVPPTVLTSTRYAIADDFYKAVYEQITQGDLLERTFSDVTARFPNKQFYITEFGPLVGVGNMGNTLGYEATVDWFLNRIQSYPVKAVCKFNGPGTPTGSTTPRSAKDLSTLPSQVKRTDHYTQKLFLMNKGALPEGQLITEAGSYTFSVHNMVRDGRDITVNVADGLIVTEKYYEYISGSNYYSSSGVCQWWLTGSDKTYEIDDIYVSTSIPALSFGYVHVTVEREIVYGCTDFLALNFNMFATDDDGSCYYQRDCGCKIEGALNYDPAAPCEDNLKCEYFVCMKKRWFFSGCKTSTKNCNCN